jgi:hypothetical protein
MGFWPRTRSCGRWWCRKGRPHRGKRPPRPPPSSSARSTMRVSLSHRISWARPRLIKRVFDLDMQHCPHCGAGELKIIAAIPELPVVEKILTHLGLDPQPPPRDRARGAQLRRLSCPGLPLHRQVPSWALPKAFESPIPAGAAAADSCADYRGAPPAARGCCQAGRRRSRRRAWRR